MNEPVHVAAIFDSVLACLVAGAVVACALALMVIFPEMPGAAADWVKRRFTATIRAGFSLGGSVSSVGRLAHRGMSCTIRHVTGMAFAHRWIIVPLSILVFAPVVAILAPVRGALELEGFDSRNAWAEPTATVAALLDGEHLAAPDPLPPAMFATREVALIRPQLESASRVWALLDDAFSQRLLQIFRLMKERHGYDMVLLEGYRSPERQNLLAKAGSHVTNAAAWQSYHQYGLAADSAFLKDGRIVISERDPWAMRGYELFGEIAAEAGLTWGGNWKMADLGHVEWRRAGARTRMK